MAIDAIGAVGGLRGVPETVAPAATGPATAGEAFRSTLDGALGHVDSLQHSADDALTLLGSGENVDIHGTMIALEKADIALRLTVSVRDKLVAAYEQVMNMAL